MTQWNDAKYDDDLLPLTPSSGMPKRFHIFTAPILAILFACAAIIVTTGLNVFVGIDSMGINLDTLLILLSLVSFVVSIYGFVRPSKFKVLLALIIIFAGLVIIAAVHLSLINRKQTNNQIFVQNNNVQSNQQVAEESTSEQVPVTESKRKPDEVTKNGNLVTYNSPSIGIQFVYNSKVYSKPNVLSEQDAKAQGYDKDLKGNVLIFPDITMGENPGTAVGSITVYNLPGYQNYIDDVKAKVLQDKECKILSEERIDGAPALRYQCAGLGDQETVIIKTWSHHVIMNAVFAGESFEELLKSIKVSKDYNSGV